MFLVASECQGPRSPNPKSILAALGPKPQNRLKTKPSGPNEWPGQVVWVCAVPCRQPLSSHGVVLGFKVSFERPVSVSQFGFSEFNLKLRVSGLGLLKVLEVSITLNPFLQQAFHFAGVAHPTAVLLGVLQSS